MTPATQEWMYASGKTMLVMAFFALIAVLTIGSPVTWLFLSLTAVAGVVWAYLTFCFLVNWGADICDQVKAWYRQESPVKVQGPG